jgi:hypothetical protein
MNRKPSWTAALSLVMVAGCALIANAGQDAHEDHAKREEAAKHDAHMKVQATAAVKVEATTEAAARAAVVAEQAPRYPLDTCVVSGEKLGGMGKPMDFVFQGRLVRFCCGNCEADFLADPAAAFAKIDAAVIAQQLPDYPMETCPVSGEPLGQMGEPYNHVHGTRLVRFCCDGCIGKFEDNPSAYFSRIDAAAAAKTEAAE